MEKMIEIYERVTGDKSLRNASYIEAYRLGSSATATWANVEGIFPYLAASSAASTVGYFLEALDWESKSTNEYELGQASECLDLAVKAEAHTLRLYGTVLRLFPDWTPRSREELLKKAWPQFPEMWE